MISSSSVTVPIGIDLLFASRRRLDYIAANSITPSRGAADCGDYREVAGAITSVIAGPLSRQCGRSLVALVSQMNFFQLGEVISAILQNFFQLGEVAHRPFRFLP
jgi:hypothetical protein